MLLKEDVGRTLIQKVPQPALYLHCAVFLADERRTVLSDETFRLITFEGQEGISTPFEFQLTLRGNTLPPSGRQIVFKELLGCRVSVVVSPPTAGRDAAGAAARGVSLFNGIVASLSMSEPGAYKLTMRPALWKLTLANRYCVYQQRNVRDVIREVCALHGVSVAFRNMNDAAHYNLATSRTQDWLQAGESDYDFVQRLMSKAHLYYYFEHDGKDHTVVFANDTQYPRIRPDTPLRYTYTSIDALGSHQGDVIAQYSYEQTLTQSGVNGAFTRQEEAWAQDGVATCQTLFKPVGDGGVEPAFNLHKIYQYGVNEQLASEFATVTAGSLKAAASQFKGGSCSSKLRAGYQFQVIEEVGPGVQPHAVRPTLDRQWFVATQVQHHASLDGVYTNEFVALSADGPVTPVSLQDTHQGVLLATVVSDGHGERPHDWRYYSKNAFDPEGAAVDDTGSQPAATGLQGVYVSLACDPHATPVWVKLAAHMQSAPEIGALVFVARANDESELPEIQSIVEAGGQMTVKPSRWIADTRVGSSYSTAYGDSKSIRYGKDSAVALQAAIERVEMKYGTKRFREVGYAQGARYSYDVSEQGRAGILSDTEAYGNTYSRAEGVEHKSYENIDYTRSEQKFRDTDSFMTTTGRSYSESKIGEAENHHTVDKDSKSYETVTGKSYSESSHGSGEAHHTVLGKSASYETYKGKRYSRSDSASEVESHATTTGKSSSYETFNGGRYNEQRIKGDSESFTNVTGTDKTTSHIGVSNHNSAIGVSNDNSVIGVSVNTGVVGSSTDLRTAVNVNQVHATALAAEVSLYGALYRTEKVGIRLGNKSVSPASVETSTGGVEIEMTVMRTIL